MEKKKIQRVDPVKQAKWIVSLNSEWKKRWDILICILVLYNSFSIPYELAFEEEHHNEIEENFNWVVDALFLIDIFVGFRTTFLDRDGKEVLQEKQMALHYLKNNFLVDIIATIPIDLIAKEGFGNEDPNLHLFGILKMGRLARLDRIIRLLTSSQEVKVMAQLSYMFISILIYLHWYSCIFWVCVRDEGTWLPQYLMNNPENGYRFLYQDQNSSNFSKYLCVLYQGVICLCGGDMNPNNRLTIYYAGFGIVLASYINANIFGQLQMILDYIYKEDKTMQIFLAKTHSAMINLKLPVSTRVKVKSDFIRYAPLEMKQEQMRLLLEYLPSSFIQSFVLYKYFSYVKNSFKMNQDATYAIAQNLEIELFWPEQAMVRINQNDIDKIYVIGQGLAYVQRHFGYVANAIIGEVGAGTILNVPQLLFECKPHSSVIFRTHAIATYIPFENMQKIIIKYQDTKQKLENFILMNPYDLERDYFIEIAQRSIYFFKRLDNMVMRKIYMACRHLFFETDQVIFEVGDQCTSIYIVILGNVEIGLSDGINYMTMDFLGRGSVIGFNGIVLESDQVYMAKVRSPRAKLIEIPKSAILGQIKNDHYLKEDVEELYKSLKFNGPPTIDFIIRYEQLSKESLHHQLSSFKKSNLWEQGETSLIRFVDVVFQDHFKELKAQYKIPDVVKSQDILCKIMFNAQGKNSGLAKFKRGFRRLRVMIRFARLIGEDFDPSLMDLGALTLFNVRSRQLQYEGMSLNDYVDYLEYKIIGMLSSDKFLPLDTMEELETLINKIQKQSWINTQEVKDSSIVIRQKVNWRKNFGNRDIFHKTLAALKEFEADQKEEKLKLEK